MKPHFGVFVASVTINFFPIKFKTSHLSFLNSKGVIMGLNEYKISGGVNLVLPFSLDKA